MVSQRKPLSLNQIRKKIDGLDLVILKALSERVKYVVQAGEIKKKNNDLSFYKPEREAQIIRNIVLKNKSLLFYKRINQRRTYKFLQFFSARCFNS